MCHACGLTLAIVVDHDHFTGFVHGLLCWTCNAWIDECPHLDGCPRAYYLNDPPARHLRVRYPLAHRDREHDRARIEYLGIDPFPRPGRTTAGKEAEGQPAPLASCCPGWSGGRSAGSG